MKGRLRELLQILTPIVMHVATLRLGVPTHDLVLVWVVLRRLSVLTNMILWPYVSCVLAKQWAFGGLDFRNTWEKTTPVDRVLE